jgi:hypothetical protein
MRCPLVKPAPRVQPIPGSTRENHRISSVRATQDQPPKAIATPTIAHPIATITSPVGHGYRRTYLVSARATVTAGLANEVEEVNQ